MIEEAEDIEIIDLISDESMEYVSSTDTEDSFTSAHNYNCPRCSRMIPGENVVVLKECKHWVCKECIIDGYFKDKKNAMKCHFKLASSDACGHMISENEIREVLHEIGINDQPGGNTIRNSFSPQARAADSLTEESFCCGICYLVLPIGRCVKLSACSHHVCDPCLRETIESNTDVDIKCPYSRSYENCGCFLTHQEIQRLTSAEEFQKFQQIGVKKANEPSELFMLMMMEELSCIKNVEPFDCPICFVPCDVSEGIKLRDCLHELCVECFIDTVTHSDDEPIKCPFTDGNLAHCDSSFQEREIRAVVPDDVYNKFLERKLKLAESKIANTFHCQTVNCRGFGIIEPGDNEMLCSICQQRNCLQCKAIHKDMTCEDYQDSLTGQFKVTERYINTLKTIGDVMNCPSCSALINRSHGCSFLQCAFCKTGICWATKGPRWGPKGTGDTSGGCRCLVNGKRCHPECQNCH